MDKSDIYPGAVSGPIRNVSAQRYIGKLRKFLNTDTFKSTIVSLVTSHLDYCNGLFC